jgi:RNA methyltransferase, TrmH family
MADLITSLSNPLVKLARSLRQRKARRASGLFLVEGILHLGEAVAAGWRIDSILYAPELLSSDFASSLVAEQAAKGVRCQPVSSQVFESLADKENPQGILALVEGPGSRLDQLAPEHIKRGAALVSPQDPGNIGTILRTLDAVDGDGLFLLDGGADPFQPAAVRASMGTLFWKPVVQTSFSAFVGWVRTGECQLIGTSAHGSIDYREVHPGSERWMLLLGSEQKGLSREQAAACDLLVRIPMHGRASSLNLAVAAGILLYQLAEK